MIKRRKIQRIIQQVISSILIAVMLLFYPQIIKAEDQNTVLKVGFFAFDGYHNIDDDGCRSGYGYEFIQKMLCYNNYTAEYIGYDKNWSDMQEMLENGEIDILTSAQKTAAREEKFDFSEPIGTSAAILTVKEGNNQYIAGEYSTYNGIRVGVIEGNSRNDRFEEFAKEKGFTYQLIYYDDMASLSDDLQNSNKIDAIVTSNLRTIRNEWILDKFATSEFYAMVKKGNVELLNKVNYAINLMNSNSVGWQDTLFNKYYAGQNGDSIALSSTERDYLSTLKKNNVSISVLVHPDRAPYCYVENGEAKGIIPELFDEIARRLDLPYEYVIPDTREEYAKIKAGREVDVILEARDNLSKFEDIGYKLTDAFMNISYASVERTEVSGDVNTIATINEAYSSDENLRKLLDGKTIKYYDDLKQCVDAVINREVDACYMYDYSAQKFASENIKGSLQATTIPDIQDSLTLAVRATGDYRLLSVLNKGVDSISGEYVDTKIKDNTDFSIGKLTIIQTLMRNPGIMVLLIVLTAFVILLLVYVLLRKKNAKKILQKNKELEHARESLKEALTAANQASESKGSFLSNMSHEIRTPLNAIIGYLSLAKDKDVSNEKRDHCIDNCEIASKHLLQIINDILDMSSIESGKLKIAHEDFDLKKEITDITTIFFQNARAKGVEFETQVAALTQEWVIGDQLRLNQILMNLLSNAIKFTPEKGLVTLKINQIREDDDKVYMQFIVSDTGIGMSPEYMSRIFTPFEQENAGTAKKFGGSGLGLSITHNLIKMMGGTITVDSRQNEGTTFTVTMFFDKSKVQGEPVMQQVDYSHVRVLVVDDKEDECTYVKTMLKRCGVKSDCVTSGENALKRIKSRIGGDYSYDLCIIDWNMPDMNGCEVTKRIRSEMGMDVPIIIATAYDIGEFQDEAKKIGVNKVVAKPLFQSTLFDILVSTFGRYDPKASSEEDSLQINMSGVHLLLAEDNLMNMEIAVTMLEKAGIKVDQAFNGKEAYDIFTSNEQGTYDLILMDVQMPVMDGYEATKQIRTSNHPEAKTIPIIAMTANAFAEDVAEALARGMNAHIAKPINYDKLFAVLKQYARK